MKMFLLIIGILSMMPVAHADFFVVYDKSTMEVLNYSLAKDDFRIAEAEQSKLDVKKIDGNLKDYIGDSPIQNFKVNGTRLVLNSKKVSDSQQEIVANDAKILEWRAIEKKAQQMAYESLKSDGKEFKYITDADFK